MVRHVITYLWTHTNVVRRFCDDAHVNLVYAVPGTLILRNQSLEYRKGERTFCLEHYREPFILQNFMVRA